MAVRRQIWNGSGQDATALTLKNIDPDTLMPGLKGVADWHDPGLVLWIAAHGPVPAPSADEAAKHANRRRKRTKSSSETPTIGQDPANRKKQKLDTDHTSPAASAADSSHVMDMVDTYVDERSDKTITKLFLDVAHELDTPTYRRMAIIIQAYRKRVSPPPYEVLWKAREFLSVKLETKPKTPVNTIWSCSDFCRWLETTEKVSEEVSKQTEPKASGQATTEKPKWELEQGIGATLRPIRGGQRW